MSESTHQPMPSAEPTPVEQFDAVELGAVAAEKVLQGDLKPIFTGQLGDPVQRELTDRDPAEANDLAHEQEVGHLQTTLNAATAERDQYKQQVEHHSTAEKILAARVAKAERLAMYDKDTGLPNKLGLEVIYDELSSRSRRRGENLSLLFVDLDNFKKYNTLIGHLKTDEFVVAVSSLLRGSLREGDILGRWAGDEFVVLLPSTDVEGARKLGDKLRGGVKVIKKVGDQEVSPTLSVGVSAVSGDQSFSEACEPANQAMHLAKQQGRDRTVVSGSAA